MKYQNIIKKPTQLIFNQKYIYKINKNIFIIQKIKNENFQYFKFIICNNISRMFF